MRTIVSNKTSVPEAVALLVAYKVIIDGQATKKGDLHGIETQYTLGTFSDGYPNGVSVISRQLKTGHLLTIREG